MSKKNEFLNLDNTANAFAYKTDKELKASKWLFTLMKIGFLVRLGAKILPFLIEIGLPIKNLIKKTLFKQFVGGETLEKTTSVCEKLNNHKVQVILDYGVEGGEYNDDKYEQATDQFINVIDYASKSKNTPFISIKITGLISFSLLERLNITLGNNTTKTIFNGFAPIIEMLPENDKLDWKKLYTRINRICTKASESGIGVMIDAEESWIQDPIDYLTMCMMEQYNKSKVVVYNTIQLYRTDRLPFLIQSYEESVLKEYLLGVKLVRGAYMEKESKRAEKHGYNNPIQQSKLATDRDYNEALSYCIERIEKISIIVASHNEESSLKAANMVFDLSGMTKHQHLHFSQLYGMSDNLTFNLANAGYNASKYLPFGPVEEVIPYLMRRAQENSSLSGQTGRELKLIIQECKRRGI
jgi:proline dehydrogenase